MKIFDPKFAKLASSSLGLRENISPKQATRLGEVIPSALSKQLA